MLRRLICVGLIFCAAAASADTLPTPVGTVTLPSPDSNAFFTSFRYDSTGTLYAWDGLTVWKQGPGGAFSSIGQVPAGNSADAGPINFSQDGSQILVGNGAGGVVGGAYSGLVFDVPKAGGNPIAPVGTVPFQQDFIPVPSTAAISGSASKYFVDQGNSSFSASSVSVFDSATGTNVTVIANIDGASASIAIDPANNRLYAESGFGATAGLIRSFSLTDVASAFASGIPLDFNSGTAFNTVTTPQSGAGMFFDKDGYLFAGGSGGISVFNPDGSVRFVEDPTDFNVFTTLAYNPATDQVLEGPGFGSNTATIFDAVDFEPAVATGGGGGSVPLPKAAWVGMIALMGLAFVKPMRRRKFVA